MTLDTLPLDTGHWTLADPEATQQQLREQTREGGRAWRHAAAVQLARLLQREAFIC